MSNLLDKRRVFFIFLIISVILAMMGLKTRIEAEKHNRTVGFISDYRVLLSLANNHQQNPVDVWHQLNEVGLTGIAVAEYAGNGIVSFMPKGFTLGTASSFLLSGKNAGVEAESDWAALKFPADWKYRDKVEEYLKIKLPGVKFITENNYCVALLPGVIDDYRQSGFLPDFEALEFAKSNNIPVSFRASPCNVATGEDTAVGIKYLVEQYPQIKNITVAGLIVVAYPDIMPLAEVMNEKGISLSQVEFVNQVGVASLAAKLHGKVLPMHSLTHDEIISRIITRKTITDRYIRAVHERSIRLFFIHPYDLQLGNRLEEFAKDLAIYKNDLEKIGYTIAWPEPTGEWNSSLFAALSCVLVFLCCLFMYASRLLKTEKDLIKPTELLVFAAAFAMLTVVFLKLNTVSKILGGFCGAFAATEGALFALDNNSRHKFFDAVGGLFIVLAGGLSIAAYYGTSAAALRLSPFSGVKLTLLLPLILIFMHDMKLGIHPEKLSEIAVRPAIWGELAMVGFMMIAVAVMALRSDNVSNVPAFEIAFRNFIEKVMVVRPRTKEFLIGYPALVLFWYLKKFNFIPKYREAVRIAAILAFSSGVNTFCHFHTRIYLSVIRVLNGWWLGLLLGFIGVTLLHIFVTKIFKTRQKQAVN